MVPSRQSPTCWTEASFFREGLHRSWVDAFYFKHVLQHVQPVRAAWYDGEKVESVLRFIGGLAFGPGRLLFAAAAVCAFCFLLQFDWFIHSWLLGSG